LGRAHSFFLIYAAYRPYTFSLKELIVLINKRVMRVVVWLMIAAMLFSTVMYLVAAFTGI
jgi:hypothetical protein